MSVHAICLNNHKWGDGKEVEMNSHCPICSGPVSGFVSNVVMEIKDVKRIYGSEVIKDKKYAKNNRTNKRPDA